MDSKAIRDNPNIFFKPAAPAGGSPAPPATPWILRPRAVSSPRLRLFCLPYAGGAASVYRPWSESLPAEIDLCPVQLPGRGSRFRERSTRRLAELLPAMADALQPYLDMPFALFGHSMGALLAFELTRELRRRSWAAPVLLAVSGHRAPQRPDPDEPFGHLPDPGFLAEMQRRYDGIPPEVLAEKELLQLMLPVLRADIEVLETYTYAEGEPLDCPLSCFGGTADGHVRRDDLEAWREQAKGGFSLRMLPGGHFFIDSARPALLSALRSDVAPWIAAGQAGPPP